MVVHDDVADGGRGNAVAMPTPTPATRSFHCMTGKQPAKPTPVWLCIATRVSHTLLRFPLPARRWRHAYRRSPPTSSRSTCLRVLPPSPALSPQQMPPPVAALPSGLGRPPPALHRPAWHQACHGNWQPLHHRQQHDVSYHMHMNFLNMSSRWPLNATRMMASAPPRFFCS